MHVQQSMYSWNLKLETKATTYSSISVDIQRDFGNKPIQFYIKFNMVINIHEYYYIARKTECAIRHEDHSNDDDDLRSRVLCERREIDSCPVSRFASWEQIRAVSVRWFTFYWKSGVSKIEFIKNSIYWDILALELYHIFLKID